MPAAIRFLDILSALCRHEVDYIVVDGVAAILEGAPVSTFDVDIMHRSTEENHGRLDILTEIAPELGYDDVAGDTVAYSPAGLEVRVLSLPLPRRTLALKRER